MKALYLLALGLSPALAFPTAIQGLLADPDIRAILDTPAAKEHMKRAVNPAVAISQAEGNCGPVPCTTFDPTEQYVSTTGDHAYQSPAASDIRGPCPGLNAAANHGYLNRNGVQDLPTLVSGLSEAYGFGDGFSAALNAFSSIISGDIVTETWSIGGPQPFSIDPLGTPPQGISYAHNKYEGDTSIVRNDAYLNNGDAHSANATKFAEAIAVGRDNNRYTLDKFRNLVLMNQQFSIENNPYYFSPFVSTTAVAPAAYNFVINFMSNHSADEPSGYLDEYNFKTFFAMEGEYPNYTWLPGQERIPDNWYRRPQANPYDIKSFAADLAIQWAAYPDSFKLGGNTNGVNTYKGIDVFSLTNGSYSLESLSQPANVACLFFQTQQEAIPDELKGGVNDVAAALALFQSTLGPVLQQFNCTALAGYDSSLFNQYPGRTYDPTGPATNYKA